MSQFQDKLNALIEPAVEAAGFELIGVEFVRAGKHSTLRVYIDHPDGITVDDCAEVSYQVSSVMDVEDPISTEYNLEVSSPGMDRPLFKPAHYQAVVGQVVSLRLRIPQGNRRNFKGEVLGVADDKLTIQVDNEQFELVISNIEKGNLVPQF
ncbi:ribosome maturation factor RimP [Planctobacterium marinum]|uniref:ribosome maturation factor RimP n=1 Tax=Planctobacterium marinum TaxID=1631968 RepID=UPI001E327BA9|nr:ribosome maturation factor RimP [Planctobacterium marinum]MCC2605487.1 ribosome maturation factor RimP [Planctobacterium marinum]